MEGGAVNDTLCDLDLPVARGGYPKLENVIIDHVKNPISLPKTLKVAISIPSSNPYAACP